MTLGSQYWEKDDLSITYTHHKSNQQRKCSRWFKGKQPFLNVEMGKEEQNLVTEITDKWLHKNQKEKPARIRSVHAMSAHRIVCSKKKGVVNSTIPSGRPRSRRIQ